MSLKTNQKDATASKPLYLPRDGMSRLKDILPFLPFKKSKLYTLLDEGNFPKPYKLSGNCVAWKNADIHAYLDNITSTDSEV